jgi:UDP-glucuronate decarboxylase
MDGGNGRLKTKTALVAGGAGFVGSHLCDALLAAGHCVICVDNFLTGALRNVAPLQNRPDFTLIRHDVCEALTLPRPVDRVFNLACAASPQRYQADPVHTMMTSVAGVKNLLSLAEEHGAVFVQASTSEVYGDPEEHPRDRAPAMTRASAPPKPCASIFCAPAGSTRASRASSTHTGRACRPMMAASYRT